MEKMIETEEISFKKLYLRTLRAQFCPGAGWGGVGLGGCGGWGWGGGAGVGVGVEMSSMA